MNPAEQLTRGLSELELHVATATQRKLLDYLALIAKWNRVHNLTAVRESNKIVSSHLLDSLAVVPYLQADSVLDVGSGAGLPGVPLALMWPHTRVTLLDSNHKKAAFLRQTVIELGIDNAEVICERVEIWRPPRLYDLVISRAFSDLAEFLRLAGGHCAVRGTAAAMKGVYPHEELGQLPKDFELKRVAALSVPGLSAARHLVLLTRQH